VGSSSDSLDEDTSFGRPDLEVEVPQEAHSEQAVDVVPQIGNVDLTASTNISSLTRSNEVTDLIGPEQPRRRYRRAQRAHRSIVLRSFGRTKF